MKRFLRSLFIHFVVLWLVALNVGGIEFQDQIQILLIAAAALTLADAFLRPLINLFLLPFNLVTLGVFRWVSNVLMLYLTTLVVPGFSINAFTYPGLDSQLFIIPEVSFSLVMAYVVISIITSSLSSILFWLVH